MLDLMQCEILMEHALSVGCYVTDGQNVVYSVLYQKTVSGSSIIMKRKECFVVVQQGDNLLLDSST